MAACCPLPPPPPDCFPPYLTWHVKHNLVYRTLRQPDHHRQRRSGPSCDQGGFCLAGLHACRAAANERRKGELWHFASSAPPARCFVRWFFFSPAALLPETLFEKPEGGRPAFGPAKFVVCPGRNSFFRPRPSTSSSRLLLLLPVVVRGACCGVLKSEMLCRDGQTCWLGARPRPPSLNAA